MPELWAHFFDPGWCGRTHEGNGPFPILLQRVWNSFFKRNQHADSKCFKGWIEVSLSQGLILYHSTSSQKRTWEPMCRAPCANSNSGLHTKFSTISKTGSVAISPSWFRMLSKDTRKSYTITGRCELWGHSSSSIDSCLTNYYAAALNTAISIDQHDSLEPSSYFSFLFLFWHYLLISSHHSWDQGSRETRGQCLLISEEGLTSSICFFTKARDMIISITIQHPVGVLHLLQEVQFCSITQPSSKLALCTSRKCTIAIAGTVGWILPDWPALCSPWQRVLRDETL